MLEVIGISTIATAVSAYWVPITNVIQCLQHWLVFYAIYQVFVIVIATNLNDIQKDSWLAVKNLYEMILYYCRTRDKSIKPAISERLHQMMDKDTVLTPKARAIGEAISNYEARADDTGNYQAVADQANRGLIFINHQLAVCELKWKYSLILRLFK